MSSDNRSLIYEEPDVTKVLIQGSFLITLNIFDFVMNRTVYCGLIGQILVGIIWGKPLGNWLDQTAQKVIMDLGYLGLILLVYQGGLNSSLKHLLSDLPLSSLVAFTGISLPIALSFILVPLVNASPISCFAAGAALSSTSLGTAFTILTTAGFQNTRLGTILTSAAMMDDVIGLVMINIVASMSSVNGENVNPEAIIRPIGASLGLILAISIGGRLGRYLLLERTLLSIQYKYCQSSFPSIDFKLLLHMLLLSGVVAVAGYSGAPVLFASFLTGSLISWFDESKMKRVQKGKSSAEESKEIKSNKDEDVDRWTGIKMYNYYYDQPVERILKPFFFASIGFSIPITEMFHGHIIWRGLIYSVLMIIGKLITGAWLLGPSISLPFGWVARLGGSLRKAMTKLNYCIGWGEKGTPENRKTTEERTGSQKLSDRSTPVSSSGSKQCDPITEVPTVPNPDPSPHPEVQGSTSPSPSAPRSLYPPAILGFAMVSRGEISYLIAAVAQSQGVFSSDSESSSTIFLVVIWAATVCTFVGPVVVGLLVKRLKLAEKTRESVGGRDVLGVWGVDSRMAVDVARISDRGRGDVN